MREIKFRGKAVMTIDELDEMWIKHDNGWVYGNLIVDDDAVYVVGGIADRGYDYIAHEWWVEVEPDSVGQCTGVKAKDGTLVYEGDIVETGEGFKGVVKYADGCFYLSLFGIDEEVNQCICLKDWAIKRVLGNIFEDPVLWSD